METGSQCRRWRLVAGLIGLSLLVAACGGSKVEPGKPDGGAQKPPAAGGAKSEGSAAPGQAVAYTPPVLGSANAPIVILDYSDFL